MINRTSTSIIAVFSIVIAVAIMCSALFVGVAGAQFFPTPFGYDGFGYGYGQYGYPGLDSYYGMPLGLPAIGSPLTPLGMPAYGGLPYGAPSIAGPQMPIGMPSYASPQMQMPVSAPSYAVQQPQVPVSQPVVSGGTAGTFTIPGLEGLQGFGSGDNKLSLAVIPVTQQNGQMGYQVIGFAITSSGNSQAAVYSLSTPLACVIDPTQNTLQVDLTNLANNIDQAGYIPSDQVYSTIRSSAKVMVVDVDMAYQGNQGTQTTFSVNTVDIITPDGKMQAFSLQQPTQLVIDSQSMRIFMVAFPQMVDAFNGFYGASYSDVLPIVYAQPIPILAPIFVPYLQPFPIFFSTFVGFNPFFFGGGFVSFYNRASFHGNFPIHDRDFARNVVRPGEIGKTLPAGRGSEIGKNLPGEIGRNLPGGKQIGDGLAGIGKQAGIGQNIGTKPIGSNIKPGNTGAGNNMNLRPATGNSMPGNIGKGTGAGTGSSFAPGNIGTGTGRGIGTGISPGIGTGMGTGMGRGVGSGIGSGMGGSGMRLGGRR